METLQVSQQRAGMFSFQPPRILLWKIMKMYFKKDRKNEKENRRERVILVAKSPSRKKSFMLPEHSDLREKCEMLLCQSAGTSEDKGSNGER